jgi:hypothetical protein
MDNIKSAVIITCVYTFSKKSMDLKKMKKQRSPAKRRSMVSSIFVVLCIKNYFNKILILRKTI